MVDAKMAGVRSPTPVLGPATALVATLVGVVLVAPARAQAQQACNEGRVVSAETEGRCCWPAQRWSAALGRCEGPPQCPSGLVAEGDSCVTVSAPAAASTPAASAAPASAGVVIAAPGNAPLGVVAGAPGLVSAPRAVVRRVPLYALAFSGLALFTTMYLTTIGVTAALCSPRACAAFIGMAAIPVFGPIAQVAHPGNGSSYAALQIAVSLLQLGGFTMMVAGFAARRSVTVVRPASPAVLALRRDPSPAIALLPWATDRAAGVELTVTNF